ERWPKAGALIVPPEEFASLRIQRERELADLAAGWPRRIQAGASGAEDSPIGQRGRTIIHAIGDLKPVPGAERMLPGDLVRLDIHRVFGVGLRAAKDHQTAVLDG